MIFQHTALSCLGDDGCQQIYIDEAVAELAHFRPDCTYNVAKEWCDDYKTNLINDSSVLWRFKDQLVSRVAAAKQTLN